MNAFASSGFGAQEIIMFVLIAIAIIVVSKYQKKRKVNNTNVNAPYNQASKSVETVRAQTSNSFSEETVKAEATFDTKVQESQAGCLPIGSLLQDGRYKVVRYLASGGFGNTYVVEHTRLKTQWAMKEFFMRGINSREGTTVTVSLAENKDVYVQMKEKFLKEAQRMSGLKNEHIVELIDFFEENGTAYYVMKFVEGQSLSDVLKASRAPLSESQVTLILPQVLDALRCMHEHQLYHLDLKPGNIMQDSNGHVCLIDFGSSKQLSAAGGQTLTTTTGLSYTPGFAPSELVSGNMKRIGPWTDFYSLGATLYNLLTNKMPPEENDIMYDGEKAFELGSVSRGMQELILRLMNPRYNLRPQSVDEIERMTKRMSLPSDTPKTKQYESAMSIKGFTESAIALYLEKGGSVNPDITLDIFQLIEKDEDLLRNYMSLTEKYKEVNPTIGKTIREHFDLRNDKVIIVTGQCHLIKNYMRFC